MTKKEIRKKIKALQEEVSRISNSYDNKLSYELLAKIEPLYNQMDLLEKELEK